MALPLGAWLSPGATERGLRYQSRVRAALDVVTPIMARAVQQQVRDPMQRFREVEARLQPGARRPQVAPRGPMLPVAGAPQYEPGGRMPRIGTPVFTPTPAPEMAPLPLIQPGYTEEQVRQGMLPGLTGTGPDPIGWGLKQVMKGIQHIEGPVAAASLQAVSRTGPLGGPAMGPAQQVREMPMERKPIGEELVNPVSAWLGDKEERRKVEEVLEEAGLPATLMAYFFTSPLNALPIVGFSKADDFVRVLKLAGKAKGAARANIMSRPAVKSTIAAIRSEAGGPRVPGGRLRRPTPEGMRLTNDIPTTAEIWGRLADVDAELAKPKIKGGRQAMLTERAKLQAQADIDEVLASGRPVEGQFGALEAELEEIRLELQTRTLPFRGRYRYSGAQAPQFGPEFKEWQRGRPSVGRREEAMAARTQERYPGVSTNELNARERVYAEFIKNAKFEPEEALVGRARFTPEGEVVREPTYATEGELAGARPRQGELGIGAGERPVETAGPMFREGAEPPRGPPREPPRPTAQMPPEPERIPSLREVEADAFPKLTPEERARYVPERPGVYTPDDFEEVGTRILSGADETVMRFAERLVRVPGVKQIVGAVNRIAEARGNPVLMARIKNGIFKAIESNRADVAVLRWKKEMLDAFSWSKDWTAAVSLRSGAKGVPKKAIGHIEDLLAHTDDYVLTDVQRAALDHGRGLRDNMLRQQLSNGVDVLPVKGEYMRRIVTATPEGKVRNGVVQRGVRIGGRKGSQKPRAFEEIRDGFRAGYDYERDPFALMSTRLHEGVTTMADKRALKLVAAEGETMAERVPMQIREEAVRTRQALVAARKVASRRGASVADKTAWEVAKRDYVQARKVWQEVRRRVREPGWGEVRGPGNRIFDEQFAKELTEWTTSGSESVVQQANLLVRAFKTTGDLSATAVQMGLTALTHPLVWAKGTVRGVMSTLADPLTWAHANYEALDEAIKFGAAARPTEFMFANTGLSSIPLRIPYIGSLFRGSNRAFQWAIVQAQTDLWKIHRRGLTSTDDLASAAASVRKQLGTLESAALGIGSKQKALESTVAFAARFLRANTGLLTDLGMRGPRGRIARETLGRFFVAGTTLTIGFNMALNGGKLPNLTNPHEAGWFKVRLGKDSYVSVFGPFYPFMHLVAKDADLLAQGKITDIHKPLAWFIQSKAGIPFRTAADLYMASRGQETNIFGDRLPTDPAGAAEFIARQFAPIGAEQAAEGITEGRPEAGMEMVGVNVTRVSAYRHLMEGWERERGNRDIPDVSFDEAGDPFKIAEQDPMLAPLVQEVYASGQKRGTPGAKRAETIETARLGLEESTGLVKAAQDIESGVPGAKAEFAYSFEEYTTQTIGANEVVYRGMVRDPESEEDKNLQAYYEIEKTDYPNPDGPGFDLDTFYSAKDAAFAKLSPQLQKAMENDIKSVNPLVQQYEPEYREARRIRGELFDIPKHQGFTVEEENEAKDFRNLVKQARDRIGSTKDSTIEEYLIVARDNKVAAKMAHMAFALRPNSAGEISLRDIRYTEFLVDNASKLAPYYPYLYPRRMLPALDPETKEEVIAAGVR